MLELSWSRRCLFPHQENSMAALQPYVINQKTEQTRNDRYRRPRSLRVPYPTDNRQTRLDLGSQERVEIRNQKYSSRRTQIMAPLDIWYTAYLLKRLTHTMLHVWWPTWKTFTANSLTYSARFSNIIDDNCFKSPIMACVSDGVFALKYPSVLTQ